MNPSGHLSPIRADFDAFLVLADCLSLSRAADRLGVQQSGLSKLLKRLESEFRNPLFVRLPQGLSLTQEGVALQRRISGLRAEWDRLSGQTVGDMQPSLSLRIAAHATLAATYFPTFVPKLLKARPSLDLHIELGSSREITRRVARGTLDLGVVVDPEPFQSLVIHRLAEETVSIYAAGAAAASTKIDHPVLYQPDMVGIGKILRRARPSRAIPITDYNVIAAMASGGAMRAILPSGVAIRYADLRAVGPTLGRFKISLISNGLYRTKEMREITEMISRA